MCPTHELYLPYSSKHQSAKFVVSISDEICHRIPTQICLSILVYLHVDLPVRWRVLDVGSPENTLGKEMGLLANAEILDLVSKQSWYMNLSKGQESWSIYEGPTRRWT
ncbi:hypothetical protein E4T56_gene5039 [Termitomyces sp. T112]|nr:hypothetical protein E4T56_gene5039 [Termitomyces sp. T112]